MADVNRGKPGDWWDYAVNAVVGCSKNCEFPGGGVCWARGQAKRNVRNCSLCCAFTPHRHACRLGDATDIRNSWVMAYSIMGEPLDPALSAPDLLDDLEFLRLYSDHTIVVLTKHPERVAEVVPTGRWNAVICRHMPSLTEADGVWWLTSCHDQATVDERVPQLLAARRVTPWSVLGLHLEPMSGPVDLRPWLQAFWCPKDNPAACGTCRDCDGLDWVVVGGLTRPGKPRWRSQPPELPTWVDDIVAQCRAARVPCWVKGNVAWTCASCGKARDGLRCDCGSSRNGWWAWPMDRPERSA